MPILEKACAGWYCACGFSLRGEGKQEPSHRTQGMAQKGGREMFMVAIAG